MNLPTRVTVARIALIPIFVLIFCLKEVFEQYYILMTIVFIIASCTDFVDGHLARKHNLVTDLGKFLDPIADKILEATDGQISQEVQELCAKVREAKSMITGLKNQIESLRASAAVKNPEVEKEINKAIAEIDRQNALDIAADVEEAAAEAEAKIEAEAEVKAE